MQPPVSRRGMTHPSAIPPRRIPRAAFGLALFLALAAPVAAATAPQVYLSCTSGAAFISTPVCTSMTTPRGGILLTNVGTNPLVISSLTFTGPDAGDFSVSQGCVGTIPTGQICSLVLTFSPKGAGLRTAFLNINSNAPGSPYLFPVNGIGTGSSGGLSPSTVSFGSQAVNSTSAPQTVTLTNTGSTALNITGVSVTAGAPFAITSGGTPGTLAAGASRAITVTFTPTAAVPQSATLTVATDSTCGTFSAMLTGTGTSVGSTSPAVGLTGASFASQCVNTTSPAQTVTLTNTGTADLNITGISLPAGSPFQFASGNQVGTLAAGASRSILVTFTPTVPGMQTADLIVTSNAASSPNKITLSAVGISTGATATLTPGTVPFGTQTTGTTSGVQNITLTNTSGGPLTISSIGLSAGAQFQITAGQTAGTLPIGGTQTISVVFKPTSTGLQTATLTVAGAALCGPLTTTLTGTGQSPTGTTSVSLSRTYMSFAGVCLGGTVGPLCFTITNTGSAAVALNDISVTNCSSSIDPHYIDCAKVAGFQIVSGGTPGTLAAGQSRDVCLTFTPGEAATFSAFVMISTSASTTPLQVELHGTGDNCGGPPAPAVMLTGPTFAAQCVGTTSAAQTVTLKNTGNADLNITSIMLPAGSPFKITSGDTPGTLAAGASRSILVTFSPGAPGVQTADLTVVSNAASNPNKITLSARGITSADIATLTPGTVPFGSHPVNTTSSEQSLTLTNVSGAPLTLSHIGLSAGAQFAITSGDTAGTLPVGGTQTIKVVFKPTGTTPQTATLTVESATLCTPLTATLTGTGTPPPPNPAVGLSLAESFTQCVGTVGAAQTITLTNTGGADLNLASITLPPGSPFKITGGDTPGTLAAGASRSILVTFSPTVAGPQSADLTVVSNAASSPDKITLPGLGTTAATTATVAPTSLTFADQAVNTPSAAKTITLTNTSGGPLSLTGLTLAGANPGSFQITAGGAAGMLAAGATRTISVVFQPIAGGAQTATLAPAIGQPGACTPVATLSGTGTCGPLSLTCPPDLNVCLPGGECAATGITTTPTVTPNVASTRLVCVRDDGQPLDAPYPFGTTTITCTATDACGNTAHCVRRVTVMPGANAQVHMFIAAVNGVPTTGMPDELHINVGDCVTLKLLVTVDGCSTVLDMTSSASFFTDPPRGTFTGSTWCATAAEANSEFPLYGDWTNACTGTTTRDTVHIHVNRNDGLQ